ncbi:MAG: 50S ribosomal protein L17 [Bacteroidetes bacterium]|nr:50S ribosomal protein L17 [Bacteroidota bacterium]
MRHQKKGFKLGRTSSHRKATLSSMATALIRHKRITTTLTKAKALRQYAEPIINRGKEDTTHNRREVFRHLQDKHAVTELFTEISGKIKDREGGYLRIVKLGQRAGDSAEMALIELVDYNDVKPFGSSTGSGKKTRRAGRRKSSGAAAVAAAADVADVAVEEAPEAEVAAEEAAEVEAVAEEAVVEDVAVEEAVEEAPVAEAAVAEEAAVEEAAAEEAPAAEEAAAEEEKDKEKDA